MMENVQQKRLQVFVSSTFKDLRSERQAAVESILKNGHIPAGMELFTAGNESQLITIKKWIDQSDVFLLILGNRYGSIEETSGKSYTQLEYEYAIETNKPLFSLVISDSKFDPSGEGKSDELCRFRTAVTKKMVSWWEDWKDIKIGVGESLSYFSRQPELAGWVRSESFVERSTSKTVDVEVSVGQPSQGFSSNLKKEKVMIIEDQVQVAAATAALLKYSGYVPVITHSGEEGLEQFKADRKKGEDYEAVLIDSSLPSEASINVAKAFRELDENLPLICVSGYLTEEQLDPVFDAFLSKPYSLEALQSVLR